MGEFLFTRFTESARQAVVHAQEEAKIQRRDYIGTEHMLLGLLQEENSLGSLVLNGLGVKFEAARTEVIRAVGTGDAASFTSPIPLTPHANKVCKLAEKEALALGHNYVDTPHELLGLLRDTQPSEKPRSKTGYRIDTPKTAVFPDDERSIVGEVLTELNVDLDEARKRVLAYF